MFLRPPHGEANVLGAISSQDIGALFRSACANVPAQFAGIVSPGARSRYEITLRHWQLGEARFVFSCTRLGRIKKRIELFRRRCDVSGTADCLPEVLHEQAARRWASLRGDLRKRAAEFYCSGKRFFIEVSWQTDSRGRPKTGSGYFRYPIGYPQDAAGARTGHGAYFSAPVASDNKRRGPAGMETTNAELRAQCESLLTDAIAGYAVPRWGPAGLNPLVPCPGSGNDDAVRRILAKLARQGALPVVKWRDAAELLFRRKKQQIPAMAHRAAMRRTGKRRYRFIVPVLLTPSDEINPQLSLLCPRSEQQLHPRSPPEIVELLADSETEGFGEAFVTFDKNDAHSRVTGVGNQYFDPVADRDQELSDLLIARAYLDLTEMALEQGYYDTVAEKALIKSLLIPSGEGQARPVRELYAGAPLPSDMPGLRLPPVIHPDVVGHPIFRACQMAAPGIHHGRILGG